MFKKIFILSVSIVLGFLLEAQNTDVHGNIIGKNAKSYTVYKIENSKALKGWTVDSNATVMTILLKNGMEVKINPSSIESTKKRVKRHNTTPFKKPLPKGIFTSFSIGVLPVSFNELFGGQTSINWTDSYGFEPKWSVQHKTGYNFKSGFCATAGLGVERFDRFVGLFYGGDEYRSYFLNFPVFLGIQKHFPPYKRGHAYISVDFGNALNTGSSGETHSYYYSSPSTIKMQRFFQAHIGWHRYISAHNALIFEFGYRQQKLKMDIKREYPPDFSSIVFYAYNRMSARVGISF